MLFLESRVPPPTTVPSDGTTKSMLSAFNPVGAMCTFDVNFSMSRSFPVLIPASDPIAAIFEPRLNPASFPLNNPIVPSVTNLFVGPVTRRFALSVPAVSFDPDGRLIPSAGKNASRSVAGKFCPSTFKSTTKSSPSDLYVPDRFDLALPIFATDGLITPVPFCRSYFVSKSSVSGTPDAWPPATSTAFDSFIVPFVAITPPWLTSVASISTMPPSPMDGSRNPVEARFRLAIFNFTSCGVNAASFWSTGANFSIDLHGAAAR